MSTRLEHRLLGRVTRASKEFDLLAPNDRVMVCVSGGKDSYALLHLLLVLKKRLPFPISVVAVNLDQGHPGYPKHVLPEYFASIGVEHRIIERDTLSVVREKLDEGSTYCSLCSRLRRGILYDVATELGATKVALGHHMDDVLETALLNLFFGGKLSAMPPKLLSDDGRHVVIRPLIYCYESWLAEFSEEQQFPIIPCNLCGSQENLQRQQMKALIAKLAETNPRVRGTMFAALQNVSPSHLLDTDLYQQLGIVRDRPDRATFEEPVRNDRAARASADAEARALTLAMLTGGADAGSLSNAADTQRRPRGVDDPHGTWLGASNDRDATGAAAGSNGSRWDGAPMHGAGSDGEVRAERSGGPWWPQGGKGSR